MKASLRRSVATLVGSVALFVAPAAFAAGEPCFNDIDCPNSLACGGDVCNWTMTHPMPDGMKVYTCVAAGSGTKGSEGWCTANTDCKCASVGATCRAPYCTFTKASDAPAGGGSGAGGSSGTAGTPASAGTTATAGTAAKPPAEEEGGCSVSAPSGTGTGVAVGLGLAGLALALLRRRSS